MRLLLRVNHIFFGVVKMQKRSSSEPSYQKNWENWSLQSKNSTGLRE